MVPLPYRTIASHSHSLVGFAGLCVAGIETLQSNHVLIVAFCFLPFLSLSLTQINVKNGAQNW